MSKSVPCITINTDASFNHHHKIGGYAFWIKCDLFTIKKSGNFNIAPNTALEAELMCIANAVYTLANQPELPLTKLIVVNSDCLNAFYKIGKKSNCPIGKKIALKLKEIRKRTGYTYITKVDFRHVKAHNGTADSRSYVNNWCDKSARNEMRKKLNKIN
jgi:ribonuclease HI